MLLTAGEGAWGLPAASNLAEESIRQTSERALMEAVGEFHQSQIYFVGHAPCAHHAISGQPCFINKAQLIEGSLELQPGSVYTDYAWLCREELLERIVNEQTREMFSSLLPSNL